MDSLGTFFKCNMGNIHLPYNQSKYICEGYQQQQPVIITWCFMCLTQSSGDYTYYFTYKNK